VTKSPTSTQYANELRQAEVQFNALISTDQNLKYQQNLVGGKLAIPVLPTNDWPAMLKPGD